VDQASGGFVGASTEWRDRKYAAVFEEEVRGLQRRRESDPGCTIADLEGTLRHLYHMDGTGCGRGDVQDIVMAATIAAHEHVIARWKAEAGGR
jgi:hypothetical protein